MVALVGEVAHLQTTQIQKHKLRVRVDSNDKDTFPTHNSHMNKHVLVCVW